MDRLRPFFAVRYFKHGCIQYARKVVQRLQLVWNRDRVINAFLDKRTVQSFGLASLLLLVLLDLVTVDPTVLLKLGDIFREQGLLDRNGRLAIRSLASDFKGFDIHFSFQRAIAAIIEHQNQIARVTSLNLQVLAVLLLDSLRAIGHDSLDVLHLFRQVLKCFVGAKD